MGKGKTFILSNNWWIEERKAWFVEGLSNILFCLNLDTNECEFLKSIPDENQSTLLLNPFCVKCGNSVVCLPGYGELIFGYMVIRYLLFRVN